MYDKAELTEGIKSLGIKPEDTLFVHSSMRAVGEVGGGADTVLDAFSEFMRPGLLILPTHTWALMGDSHPVFDPAADPSCVGILTELFRKRPGVLRSLHPTHSVAALGDDAPAFVAGEENWDTPCPRGGCCGRLLDRGAKVLFLGCGLYRNTFLHGVEEWNHIPNRLTPFCMPYKIRLPDGRLLDRPMHRHQSPVGGISRFYGKLEVPFFMAGVAKEGKIGDARSVLCDARGMNTLVSALLRQDPDLFLDDLPVSEEACRDAIRGLDVR